MTWEDFIGGLILWVLTLLASVVAAILRPIDLIIDRLVPGAAETVMTFFGWAQSMAQNTISFFQYMLYVLGISPTTWHLIVICTTTLFTVFMLVYPIKMLANIFRGMRA